MKERIILLLERSKWISLLSKAFRRRLGIIEPPILGIMGILSSEIKRSLRESHRLHAPSVNDKDVWSYTCTRTHAFMACCLIKHTDTFH